MVVSRRPHTDKTLTLVPGDHPFIAHESSVDYGGVKRLQTARLKAALKGGRCELKEDMNEGLLQRVRAGLFASPRTPHHMIDYCKTRVFRKTSSEGCWGPLEPRPGRRGAVGGYLPRLVVSDARIPSLRSGQAVLRNRSAALGSRNIRTSAVDACCAIAWSRSGRYLRRYASSQRQKSALTRALDCLAGAATSEKSKRMTVSALRSRTCTAS